MSPELKNDIAELKNDVGQLKDSDLEMKVHCRIRPLLSQHLGLRRARVVQSAVHQAPDDFEAKVQKAADDNRITGEQEHRLVATDLILQARSSRDANPVWIAVEVANRIDGAAAVLIPVGNGWWRRRSFCAAPISRRPPRTR